MFPNVTIHMSRVNIFFQLRIPRESPNPERRIASWYFLINIPAGIKYIFSVWTETVFGRKVAQMQGADGWLFVHTLLMNLVVYDPLLKLPIDIFIFPCGLILCRNLGISRFGGAIFSASVHVLYFGWKKTNPCFKLGYYHPNLKKQVLINSSCIH